MRKIVVVCWEGQYRLIKRNKAEIDSMADVICYPINELKEGKLDAVLFNIENSDLVILSQITDYKIAFDINNAILKSGVKCIKLTRRKCLIPCNTVARTVNEYWEYGGNDNIINMIRYVLREVLGENIIYQKPEKNFLQGIFHPKTNEVFKTTDKYLEWYGKDKELIGLLVSRYNWINNNIEIEEQVIKAIEDKGYGVLPVFSFFEKNKELGSIGFKDSIKRFFMTKEGVPYVKCVVKMTGFKCDSNEIMSQINCPILKPVCSTKSEINEWEDNEHGIKNEILWNIEHSEHDGCIEPIYIGGNCKDNHLRKAYTNGIDTLVKRVDNWVKLKNKSNLDKKIAVIVSKKDSSVEKIIQMLNNNGYNCDAYKSEVELNANIVYETFGNIRVYYQHNKSSLEDIKDMYEDVMKFGTDAIVHMGTGLLLHKLQGKTIGMSEKDYSVKLMNDLPCFYIGTDLDVEDVILFKRRAMAVAIRWDNDNVPLALINGLNGDYVSVGNENDQCFAFTKSDCVPTKEAWEKGRVLAKDIDVNDKEIYVDVSLKDMAIDGGVELSKALYLMGIKPVWEKQQKVKEFKPIAKNKTDRIEVKLNFLFSDYYGNCINECKQVINNLFG